MALAVAVGLTLAAVLALATAAPAGASHDPADANYTVEPMSDRSPGATNVKYGQIVVAQAGIDLETLEQTTAVYEEGSWASCGPGDAEVFGIDRGNTHDGYETDESLQENVKRFSAAEDRFQTEYYGEDDFGPSTHLDDGDALVSVAECIDNPDEPGWYQITGSTIGVTEDGERVSYGGESHYFWICECEDEEAAREQLGPPPSEPDSGDEPTATEGETTPEGDDGGAAEGTETAAEAEDEDDGAGGPDGDDETESAPTATPAETATQTPTDDPATDDPATDAGADSEAADGFGADATPTDTAEREWGEVVVRTPSPGGGPGFGGPVALAALAAAGALLRRRSGP